MATDLVKSYEMMKGVEIKMSDSNTAIERYLHRGMDMVERDNG